MAQGLNNELSPVQVPGGRPLCATAAGEMLLPVCGPDLSLEAPEQQLVPLTAIDSPTFPIAIECNVYLVPPYDTSLRCGSLATLRRLRTLRYLATGKILMIYFYYF